MKPIIVIALGGNALLRRGQILSYENQLENTKIAAKAIAQLANDYRIAIVHGNGPQVGLLAEQSEHYTAVPAYPLSCLIAETQGMIATMLTQELKKLTKQPITTFLTHIEVDTNDSAFIEANKFIGAAYSAEEAKKLAKKYDWQIKQDGNCYRRVVTSPTPLAIQEIDAIQTALIQQNIVICCGGGGIPVSQEQTNINCVIDKDATASLLAKTLNADYFLILTDGDGIFLNWGKENQQKLESISSQELATYQFDKGSMQPKVDAIIDYVNSVEQGIGIIADLHLAHNAILGFAGTRVIK